MAKRVTLNEIGRRAGVSDVAVGAALGLLSKNSSVRLSPEKAEMIRRVAKEMGYQPNLLARAFRRQRTKMIGVMFRVVSNPLSVSYLVDCIHRELLAQGYQAHLSPFQSTFSVLEESVRHLVSWRFDGLIFCYVFDSDDTQRRWPELELATSAAGMPVVMVESDLKTVHPHPRVGVDLPKAMETAALHLMDCGHRRLALVGDRRAHTTDRWSLVLAPPRPRGVQTQLIHLQPDPAVPAIQRMAASAHSVGRQIAAMSPRPTGIVCAGDLIAAGVVAGITASGLRVPQDAAVTGYDDSDHALTSSPPLTTLAPPIENVARAAVEMLLQRIEHPKSKIQDQQFQANLVVRQSTVAGTQ